MSDVDPVFPAASLVIGGLAVALWAFLFARVLLHYERGSERRAPWVLMSFTALLASVGALASSIGGAQQLGFLLSTIPYEALSFLANVGRGALAMAAVLLLLNHGIPRVKR